MESFIPQGGFQLPFQRRLSRLYNDTKKSSDFVQEPLQAADDPEIKTMHRKLKIQKDRLVSWGLEWSDPNQAAEIDESLSKAGLSDLVGSIMATIKDILAEAEPLWLATKRPLASEKAPEKVTGDRKTALVVWDKARFEDLVKDLTASIDTLCDLSRTRSSAATSAAAASRLPKSKASMEDLRPFGSTRIQTPQQVDPNTLTSLRSMQAMPISQTEVSQPRPQEIFFMTKQAYADLTHQPGRQPWSPLLVEYAQFDPIYSVTGIMPEMSRFEKLSAGLQTESHRAPGTWIGLPLLLGYYEDMEHSRLALVYQFPPTFNPVTFENLTQNPLDNLCTLTELLNRPDFEPALEAKFRLAYNLANTVFDMHARDITHGNLQGSSISFCNPVGNDPGMPVGEVDIRRPLISSFDVFPDSSAPGQSSDAFLLHRHPLDPRTTTQSPLASNSDTKTLDLYSLATMLISIGLWTTLENLVPNRASPSIPESVLEQLAIRCGTPYMRAVQSCWNAVDRELAHPGSIEEIISQVQVRTSRYLEACCILDGISGLDDRLGEERAPPSSTQREKLGASATSLPGSSKSPSTTRGYDVKLPAAKELPSASATKPEKLQESQPSESKPERTREKTPKLRLYPQVPLPTEVVDQWNDMLMPQINMALRNFYRKNPESVEISLESIGESPQKTSPTVLVVCTSVNKVRAILNRKLGVLFDGTQGFALKVCRGSVLRSRKGTTRSMAKSVPSVTTSEFGSANEVEEQAAANPGYQERPQNGASIGAWIGDKHLPPVTLGGIIIVDDKPYGMTVHHMLDDPDQPSKNPEELIGHMGGAKRTNVSPFRSSAAAQGMAYLQEGDSSAESSSDEFACEFSDSESGLSATDITSDDEDDEYDEDEQFNEPGDIPGVEPGCGDGYIITQPALDDVSEGFYPSAETRDEDHLDTYTVGEVYASSGIRRRNESGLVHEIDWALFEFHGNRLPDENLIPRVAVGNARPQASSYAQTLQPTEVAPAKSLPGLEVQCNARTSGLQTGQILPALASVKIYGRASPSHTYSVSGRSPVPSRHEDPTMGLQPRHGARSGHSLGVPGDSGAWVIDRFYGRVCGHVLAWSERKQVAYICPMEVLLLDIAETVEASEVRLPGGEAVVRIANVEENTDIVDVSDHESWAGEDEMEAGDDDMHPKSEPKHSLSLRHQ
ncbi:Uu.00g061900.m01.CDS01 [Anthostomella pinea]|uniref:Uu.00g061900.m01.CDS01 n=1 Tax=Anthostomella pinea TaxID=933095 RepID=A0AAI8VSJ6_9PEZI|nr:Uu.00g061900.m01.CDS01 [Anthostomella pinea]